MKNEAIMRKVEEARAANPGKVYISKGGMHFHWPGCPLVSPESFVGNPEAYDYFMINETQLPKARTKSGRRFIMCPLCHSEAEIEKAY